MKRLAAAGLVIGVLFGLLNFWLTSPWFAYRAIRLEGIKTIPPQRLRERIDPFLHQRRAWIGRQSNLFLFQPEKLAAELERSFLLPSVEFSRDGRVLVVKILEAELESLWQQEGKRFWLSADGRLIREVTDVEWGRLREPTPLLGPTPDGSVLSPPARSTLFVSLERAEPIVGEMRIDSAILHGAQMFLQEAQASFVGADTVEYDRVWSGWMRVRLLNGGLLLFDPLHDPKAQMDRIIALQHQHLLPEHFEYVDVRFEDRIYYR